MRYRGNEVKPVQGQLLTWPQLRVIDPRMPSEKI